MKRAAVFAFSVATIFVGTGISQTALSGNASDSCAATQRASYDVVSVHQTQQPSGHSSIRTRPDSLTATGVTVKRLAIYGFGLREFQLTGLPDWATSVQYDLSAKLDTPEPSLASATQEQRDAATQRELQRMQSLLIDRFGFQCHMAVKEAPVYELVVAKGGPKLVETKAAPDKRDSFNTNGSGLQMHAVGTGLTTARIAFLASGEVGCMVIDKTGLTGQYDFKVDWVHDADPLRDPQAAEASQGPTLFTAIEEQLGLKLVPAKAPVPLLVVDKVERPTEN
jgi:uncharacterized protein (TIGR03435 family)